MASWRRAAATFGLASIALTLACRQPAPPVDPLVPPTVANPALGIRLAAVPPQFLVTVNQEARLELAPAERSTAGRIWFEVGPVQDDLNLVAAVAAHRRSIEQRAGADYLGGQELLTPLGTAFYSRGRYLAGTTPTEETVVLVRHPVEVRLLTITYRYPASVDSSVRVQELLDLLGQVEAAGVSGA